MTDQTPLSLSSLPSLEVPFDLLRGLVRNPQEAQALVQLDILAQRESCLLEHIFATLAYYSCIREAARALSEAPGPAMNGARVLVQYSIDTLRHDAQYALGTLGLVNRAMRTSQAALRRYAEVNRSLSEELREEGSALASTKQQLWLIEESLCHRIALRAAHLSGLSSAVGKFAEPTERTSGA